jgi:hypothetical protein
LGIAIVTNPPSGAVHATLVPEPVLTIGAIDGPNEVLFGRIASVAVDGADRFIVADGQLGEIRIFDATGAHIQTIGGSGEGPGEFRNLGGAWPTPEGAIVAVDTRLERIIRFDPGGKLVATSTFQGPGDLPMIRPIRLAGPDAFLSRVLSLSLPSSEDAVSLDDALESLADPLGSSFEYLVLYDLTGAVVDTVATIPGEATAISSRSSGTNLSIQLIRVPFSPVPVATASPDGRVAVTHGRSYEFSLYDTVGALERIVRLADEPPIRTDEHLEAWVRASTGGREPMDDAQVEVALRSYETMPVPDRLPAWNSLHISDSGETWARRFAIRGAETVLHDVFGADGSFLGQVALPARFRIEQIGASRLTVVSTDDLGVHRVEVYELTGPSGTVDSMSISNGDRPHLGGRVSRTCSEIPEEFATSSIPGGEGLSERLCETRRINRPSSGPPPTQFRH